MNKFLTISFLLSVLVFCSSWGFLIHRTLHQTAIYYLPNQLASFYFANMQAIVAKSVDPDLRRKDDPTEETRHFIDLDDSMFKKKTIPENWDQAVKKFGEQKLKKNGTLPWEIDRTMKQLTLSFKALNKDGIILYSADLGHYLADATVPLHTTKNYDGQLTGQNGLHELWETICPQLYLSDYELYNNKTIQYIKQPNKKVWEILRQSERLVKEVLDAEINASKTFGSNEKYNVQIRNEKETKKYKAEFAAIYQPLVKKNTNIQILTASHIIASFWYTAWVNAGKPNLNVLHNEKTNIDQLEKERKAWRSETLIKENLLRSKNGNK